ncbi:hypothetical protein ACA910_022070 [Epithemia clementina (nom. ined.)]
MEQFVLGIFQEQLSNFIVGFRKEQVTANLLNGKGEIRDVELNCDFLNETASKVSPLVAFEAVHVSKVSFYVSSWTNIRKAPIFIDIEHVSASLVEPLQFLNEAEGRKTIQQITRQQLSLLVQKGLMKTRGAYNLFDRILDNLTVEVSSVQVSFQPCGKFKTRRPGPWTPPAIQMSLANIRFVSVNECGQEAPPEEVWKHNHHRHTGSLLIFKKCELQYKISIKPVNGKRIPLVTGKDNKMELQVAIERRVRDGEVLSVQMDATIPSVEVDLPQEAVPHVAHALAGIAYLVAKDREFQDPLVPEESQKKEANKRFSAPVVTTSDSTLTGDVTDEKPIDSPGLQTTVEVNIEEEGSSSDEEEGDEGSMALDKASESGESDKLKILQAPASPSRPDPSTTAPSGRQTLPDQMKNEPVIVLPNGIVIHQKISISISVYDAVIRGTYVPDETESTKTTATSERQQAFSTRKQASKYSNNCFELVSKGCIVEAIWPKVTKERGGYVQASVAYFTLEEKYRQQIKTLMSGGVQFRPDNPVELPSKPLSEFGRDETFPLFEDRVVRPDPLGLRYTFPAQAFGLKSTVDFVETPQASNDKSTANEQIQVLHEVGVDRVNFVVEAPAWCRILSFVVNEGGGGFDPRWHSGNWSRELSPQMLVSPSLPLDLDACLQTTKQIFLDENEFISSDLLNLTARLTRLETRVPACVHKDVKSCDVVVTLNEVMLLVSSALPRTMLSGRIGNSVNGDDSQKKGIIEYPNDVTDVAYELEKAEDPSNRQRGLGTSRAISTFRAQLTLRGLSVQLRPAIDFYTGHNEPFLAPSELTMIFCFEGEPPQTLDENATKMVVFMSMLVHRYEVNLDLDLLAASVSTLMFHGDTLFRRSKDLAAVIQRSTTEEETECLEPDDTPLDEGKNRIPRSLRGRRVLVQKQLVQSRESGGISVAMGFQIAELRSRLWRQHVSVQDQRTSAKSQSDSADAKKHILPAINLIDCSMKDLEIGFEAVLKKQTRRLVFKGCLSNLEVHTCDFGKLQTLDALATETTDAKGDGDSSKRLSPSDYLVELLKLPDSIEGRERTADYAFGFRMEEMLEASRRWSMSTDLANGGIFHLRPEAIETLAVHVFEALLMPYVNNAADYIKSGSTLFPEGSVGAMLQLIVPTSDAVGLNELILKAPSLPSNVRNPVEQIEVLLQKVIEKFIPENVDVVLFRSRIEKVVVAISSKNTSGYYSFNSHYADFVATYFLNGKPTDDRILQVVARKSEPWSSLFENYESGLYHRLKSRQSLSGQESCKNSLSKLQYLVLPHDFSYIFTQSKARIEMNEGLDIEGMEQFDDFVFCLRDFSSRFRRMSDNMKRVMVSLRIGGEDNGDLFANELDTENPENVVAVKTIASIRETKQVMTEMQYRVQRCENSVGSLFVKMQNCLDLHRFEAFQKEKDRMAALAIVSNQATGWLRLGSPGRTGQRGGITSTLWPYWAVLRKGFILIYNSPGKTQVLDIISLQGATLYQLAGGSKKRDLKRAFGIVQRNGMLHLVTIGTDREFHHWIKEMKRSIVAYASSSTSLKSSPSLPSALSVAYSGDNYLEPSIQPTGNPPQSKQDRGLMIPSDPASTTKHVEAGRGTRYPAGEEFDALVEIGQSEAGFGQDLAGPTTGTHAMNEDQHTTPQPETGNRRVQIRNRLAGVSQATKSRLGSASQATKSRLGSAMQKAREKGRAVAERTRQNRSTTQATDYSSVGNNDWQCPTCTFFNANSNDRCEMCNAARELDNVSRDRASSADNFSLPGSDISDGQVASSRRSEKFSDDGEGAEENEAKAGMRVRFGAALRSVRGTIRKPQAASDSTAAGDPGFLRLRDVNLTDPLMDTSTDLFDEDDYEEEILKRLEGHWFVRVKIISLSEQNIFNQQMPATLGAEMQVSTHDGALSDVLDSSNVPSPAKEPNKVEHRMLSIGIFQKQQSSGDAKLHSQIVREFSDVFSLHTAISECVGRMPAPASYPRQIVPRDDYGTLKRSLAKALGLTALEAVRTTAKLLSGLLEDGMSSGGPQSMPLTDYHAEVVSEFLNSMIDTELPIDGLISLTEFLELTDVSTSNIIGEGSERQGSFRSQFQREIDNIQASFVDIDKLTKVCQASIVQAETNSVMADRLLRTKGLRSAEASNIPQFLNVSSPVLSSRLHNAVHDALMEVMAERDQSRANFAAADVLHVHELQQERKRSKRLAEELEEKKSLLPEDKAQARIRKQQQETNNDNELLSLCQQLSTEIAARTSATLEIERLKDMRKTERSNESAEKEALQEEIRKLKEQLELERNATRTARRASSTWQKSFEEVMDFRADNQKSIRDIGPT